MASFSIFSLSQFFYSPGFALHGYQDLSWNTTDDVLRQAFSNYGQVVDVIIMRDRDTGRSRGFGFITFSSESEAESSIIGMNDQELDGRRLKVNAVQTHTTYHSGGGDNDAK